MSTGDPMSTGEGIGPGRGTGTLVERELEHTPRTAHDDGDHDRFAHYVPKNKLMEAMVEGTPVRALCGKRWVPSRDPQRFPVCPDCKRIYDSLPGGHDAGGGGNSRD